MKSNFFNLSSYLVRLTAKRGFSSPILVIAIVSMFLTPVAQANVVGASFQNFNPTASAKDYVTVHSSQTIGKGKFSLGLFINRATNTLPYVDGTADDVDQSRGNTNDSVVGADLTLGLGILDNWDVGVAVPSVLSQSIEGDEGIHGQFEENGLTELRLYTKFRLLGNSTSGLAMIGSANVNQTKNNPFKGETGSPAYNVEFAGDIDLGLISLAANLGYRFNAASEQVDGAPIKPQSNQIIASAAAGYMVKSWKSKLIAEYYASAPQKAQDEVPSRDDASSEVIAGIKRFQNENLVLHAGGGTELHHGVSTPDWRVYMGLNYVMGGDAKPAPQTRISQAAAPAEIQKPDEIFVVNDVLFKFDSAKMRSKNASANFANLAKMLRKGSPVKKIVIEGHTCNMGDAEYNRKLSYKRANVIKDILVKDYGFDRGVIKAVGFGESKPVASNTTADGRKKNRRVEFKVFREEMVASK